MVQEKYFKMWFLIFVLINLTLRLVIYYNTSIFSFGDFIFHFEGIDRIENGEQLHLTSGNFLFGISYLGYFFKHFPGNIDYFFIFNSVLGTATSVVISLLVLKVTGSKSATLLTLLFLIIYTEFMVFSSVFYTQIISIFLLSGFLSVLFYYYNSIKRLSDFAYLLIAGIILCISFFFKQELIFIPVFLILLLLFIRRDKQFVRKTLILSVVLGISTIIFYRSGVLTKADHDVLANDFIFFGHTDYGGDLGEGAFIYPENKARYMTALNQYCLDNHIKIPNQVQINKFQTQEIFRFITRHPLRWGEVQLTKFFRTFGVVPEGISFKVLYTGLLKGRLWLTSIVVVAPVVLIILLFIVFFNFSAILELTRGATAQGQDGARAQGHKGTRAHQLNDTTTQGLTGSQLPITDHRLPITDYHNSGKTGFLYIYLLLFIYYLIATIFFGQYQERYRLPIMVVFIIPALGVFIASFNKEQFLKMSSLIIKGSVIVLFLSIWTFQAKKAISNKERLENAIESVTSKQ